MRFVRHVLAVVVLLAVCCGSAAAQSGGELRLFLRSDPKTFNALLAGDDASETVGYLTGGRLIRFDRQTQELKPELASSWKALENGKRIRFKLRENVKFSDGTPFTPEDVKYSMQVLMDPKNESPHADSFRSGPGDVTVEVTGKNEVTVTFPAIVASLERQFDVVAMLSSRSPQKELAALGPFFLAEHKAGNYVLLKRNPYYWKKDGAGRQLPYLDSVRFDIAQNRDLELLRFRRGEIHLINSLDAENFDRLQQENASWVREVGVSFDVDFAWFNLSEASPVAGAKKLWFASRNFRRAVSEAINRNDICRVVYNRHASPAVGPVSPANHFWFNKKLTAHPYDPQSSLRLLQQDGFQLRDGSLFDKGGNAVEFSLITNAGNRARERMAAMIQQDLAKVGIKLNVVTLDTPSVIERITQSRDYEMCLFGFVNVDVDPMGQMNIWPSNGPMHAWNPGQKSPATPWEAELDSLMRAQASTNDAKARKAAFDRVQQIVWEQVPFIYLVHKNTMVAVSPALRNAAPVTLRPQTYWNIEYLALTPAAGQP